MGGTLEKQALEQNNDYPEITQNGKHNKNHKNKNHQIEEESTTNLAKNVNDNKSHHKRNGAPKKKEK
jgi:phage anti-repressor protein